MGAECTAPPVEGVTVDLAVLFADLDDAS